MLWVKQFSVGEQQQAWYSTNKGLGNDSLGNAL